MERLTVLEGPVTGFQITGPQIDCICGKELVKLRKDSGEILYRRTVFEKEGLSRNLLAEGGELFVYDFCTLYAFRREDYGPLGSWRLGSDLSSDICGMALDRDRVYCAIRNGKLAVLDRSSGSVREAAVSASSMWSLWVWGKHLLCGTVDGRLLLLDKDFLSLEKSLVLGKKNIGSLYLDGQALYAAGQDGKLFWVDMEDFAVRSVAKGAHKKMFHCAGVHGDRLVTVSYPCSEIALWNKNTLKKITSIETPLRLSGRAYIDEDFLYLSSRNIPGIDRLDLGGGEADKESENRGGNQIEKR